MKNGRKPLGDQERERFENYAAEIFSHFGMDMDSPGTRDTPRRWVRAMWDMTSGYEGDPKIGTVFPRECKKCTNDEYEHTVEGPISFVSLCEHHALPFIGIAYVGYIRKEKVIGISKLTRIVRVHARRFSLQERMAQEIVNHLIEIVEPYGAAVYIESHHSCTQARGVGEAHTKTRTFLARGVYLQKGNAYLREEFKDLAGLRRLQV